MTGVVWFLAGLTTGTGLMAALWRRWAEAHHYRRVRLEAIRVDVLCHDCDHYERLARRLTDEQAELREGLGDVLDTVAHQQAVIDQLTEPAPVYADFAYGANQ